MIELKEKEKENAPSKLVDIEQNFVLIPEPFIRNLELPYERISILAYLLIKTGLDNKLLLSLKEICKWMNVKIDRHKNTNTPTMRIMNVLNELRNQNILSFSEELTFSSIVDTYFNKTSFIESHKSNRFARIYIDELKNIMQYDKGNNKVLTNSVILLVFAYLRMNIPVRSMNEGLNYGAEAYDQSFKQMGIELGLSERTVSKAVNILVDLDLIRVKFRDPIQYKSGSETKFRTATNIFCNTYKRMKINGHTHLIASGESYYSEEIAQKEEQLRKMRI